MRSFIRYLLLLVFTLVALTAVLPVYYHVPYPGHAGPVFDNDVRGRYIRILEDYQVELALMGDSVLEQSVDAYALSEQLDIPSYAIAVPGSTSAFWYLILKNIILESNPQPKYVILLYRDTILTLPDFHVKGGYVTELDQYATANEDILLERAYLNFMTPLEKWALTYLPVYSLSPQLMAKVDYYARNLLPAFFLSCRGECLDRAHAIVFNMDNADPVMRENALVVDEGVLFTTQAMDFDAQINRSFLPEIIRLARENNIRLFHAAASEPNALQEYKRKMAAYLDANDVPLLDFSYDPRLPEEYFADVLHMNETGKAAFTQLLADALKTVIEAGQ
jgi:hypothetical protein